MKCPFCADPNTQVTDTRENEDGDVVRRRRRCVKCDKRFTTYERIDLKMPHIVKRNGNRTEFDHAQLAGSMKLALRKRPDLGGNGPEHGSRAAVLVECVHAEARESVDFEREVDLQEFFVVLAMGVAHDVVHHGVHCLVVQRVDIDSPHVAVNPDHGRKTGRQMQVGSLVLDAECQQLSDIHEIPL